MQFLSNERRSQLSIGQFLADHHASTTSAFTDFSSSLLQSKLQKALGKSSLEGDIVDWEVDGVRSSPIDHSNQVNIKNLLQDAKRGKESLS